MKTAAIKTILTKRRGQALVILLALAASIPILDYINKEWFGERMFYYPDRGINFILDRKGTVLLVSVSKIGAENGPRSETTPEKGEVIYPGLGVGEIRLGDTESRVAELWPGKWSRVRKGEYCGMWNRKRTLSLEFQKGRLTHISVGAGGGESGFRTEEGIGAGSKEKDILAVYGEPNSILRRYVIGSTSIPAGIASQIRHNLILAAILAAVLVFYYGRKKRSRMPAMALWGYIVFLIIEANPLRWFEYGFDSIGVLVKMWLENATLSALAALRAPIAISAIWWSEIISRRNKFGAGKRFLAIGLLIFVANIFARQLIGLLYMPFSGVEGDRAMLFDLSLFQMVLGLVGITFYIALAQFGRLFGSKSDYALLPDQEVSRSPAVVIISSPTDSGKSSR